MTLLTALQSAVGTDHVLTDADLRRSYETDWTGRFTGTALAVVRPGSTDEVAAVLRACGQHGVGVHVQGGNTGLVGGSVPTDGDVLLSLTRLTGIDDVDGAAGQVTAGAGVTLAALQDHAAAAGLAFGVDLAARDSATLGGLAATNAGGIRVLRHGSMREQVVGLEVVLADGTVMSRLGGLPKDGTGYDLSGLLCGSEGTLAVITRLRLRLVPPARETAVALLALPDAQAAVAALPVLRDQLPHLSAAEVFFDDGLRLVRDHTALPAPFSDAHGCYLLLECSAPDDPLDDLLVVLSELDDLRDAVVATDAAGVRALWAYREQHTEAISAAGVPVKLDVCLPLAVLAHVLGQLEATVRAVAPRARVVVFGHVNEGNLHVNVLGAEAEHEEVTEAVLTLVARSGGSISSEHGIGRAKAQWLCLSRTPVEVGAMQGIRTAFDPHGRLNRGVLLQL